MQGLPLSDTGLHFVKYDITSELLSIYWVEGNNHSMLPNKITTKSDVIDWLSLGRRQKLLCGFFPLKGYSSFWRPPSGIFEFIHTQNFSLYELQHTQKKLFFALLITTAIGQFQFSPPNVSLASLLAFPAELEHFNAWPGFHSSSINCWVCLFVCICICLFCVRQQ